MYPSLYFQLSKQQINILNIILQNSLMETTGKYTKMHHFIQQKLTELNDKYEEADDHVVKLQNAAKIVSYTQILHLYFQDESFLSDGLMKLATTYLELGCYEQALTRARLAKRHISLENSSKKQEIILLIGQCLFKQKKFQHAYDILLSIDEPIDKIKHKTLKLDILGQMKNIEGVSEVIKELSLLIQEKFTKSSIEYGEHIAHTGQIYHILENYERAIENYQSGMKILICQKYQNKRKAADIYLKSGTCHRKLNNHEKQHTALICASTLMKQIKDGERQYIKILHEIARNLVDREEYEEALDKLMKIRSQEKQIFGEYSVNMGKTSKKIYDTLCLLDRKPEAKKYQQEYERIMGVCSISDKEKLHGNNTKRLKALDLNKY